MEHQPAAAGKAQMVFWLQQPLFSQGFLNRITPAAKSTIQTFSNHTSGSPESGCIKVVSKRRDFDGSCVKNGWDIDTAAQKKNSDFSHPEILFYFFRTTMSHKCQMSELTQMTPQKTSHDNPKLGLIK